jgi:hypothetical protein
VATPRSPGSAGRRFSPIESFNPSFKYTPPTLTASGDVAASISPTIQISIDGGGHANLALKAGLDLNTDTTKNPWWTLMGVDVGTGPTVDVGMPVNVATDGCPDASPLAVNAGRDPTPRWGLAEEATVVARPSP